MLIATLIAFLLVASIAVVLMLDRARTEADGLRLIVEMSGMLQMSGSLRDAVEIVPVFGRRLFPKVDGALYVAVANRFDLMATWGDTSRLASVHDPDCDAARPVHPTATLQLLRVCEVAGGPNICLPLFSGSEVLGILTLRTADRSVLASLTTLFGRTFADHVCVALANVRTREKLRVRAESRPVPVVHLDAA